MKRSLSLKLFLLTLLFFISLQTQAQVETLAKKLHEAHKAGEPIPNLSLHWVFDMGNAYQIQSLFVKCRLTADEIGGFKAGLTNYESQSLYGITRPIFGVLFKSGNLSKTPEISLKRYPALMVETELGFITKKPIKQTVHSIANLKEYIGKIVPVVELPNVNFAKKPISAPELVAANACSSGYIIHPEINWIDEDINYVTVSLRHNGIIISQGQGIDALGDQWEALRWLVNQVIAQGWTIEAGNLLITGALGKIVDAKPGVYDAQFNDGVVIKFKVTS